MKDDSCSYAAFTKQGPSASQMTAAQVIDVMARLQLMQYPLVPKSECPDFWIRLPRC